MYVVSVKYNYNSHFNYTTIELTDTFCYTTICVNVKLRRLAYPGDFRPGCLGSHQRGGLLP